MAINIEGLEREAKRRLEQIMRDENRMPSKIIVVESVRILGRVAFENWEHTFEVSDDKGTLQYTGKAKMRMSG